MRVDAQSKACVNDTAIFRIFKRMHIKVIPYLWQITQNLTKLTKEVVQFSRK